jgi:hypothetical protein
MTAVQERRELSNNFENDSVAIGAAATKTFHAGVGTDGATDRYFNFSGGVSYGIEVIPTVACSITKVNGKTLKAAISVGTGGWRNTQGRFTSIEVTAGGATTVEVLMKE